MVYYSLASYIEPILGHFGIESELSFSRLANAIIGTCFWWVSCLGGTATVGIGACR